MIDRRALILDQEFLALPCLYFATFAFAIAIADVTR